MLIYDVAKLPLCPFPNLKEHSRQPHRLKLRLELVMRCEINTGKFLEVFSANSSRFNIFEAFAMN
jgi:hypothetical protein